MNYKVVIGEFWQDGEWSGTCTGLEFTCSVKSAQKAVDKAHSFAEENKIENPVILSIIKIKD